MASTFTRRAAVAVVATALAAATSCTVKNTETPALSGPSGLALTLTVRAIPDSISQDGGSQSSVKVTAIGPDGKGVANQPIRVDMMVNGVAVDYGSLSARTIVTGSDGVASVVYTAPPAPPNGVFTPCTSTLLASSLPGSCVTIIASTTATNFQTATPESVLIRLVPLGVILPVAGAPTAAFTYSPQTVSAGIPVQFDASNSTAGLGASQIASYSWSFGDGGTATGKNPSHTFAAGNNFVVSLTVTNDRGLISTPATQNLTVGSAALPTPLFTFSPVAPGVGESVFFNGSTSLPGIGHATITSYRWTFGDGGSASGANVVHAFATAGSYAVQLTVTDESGLSATSAATSVSVGAPPAPTASFSFSPASPNINDTVVFDYRTSTTAQGQRIVSLDWNFGDGTPVVHCPGNVACTSDGITTHVFQTTGTFTTNLVVTDSAGRVNATSKSISVGNGAPAVVITASPAAPTAGGTVNFNSSGTTFFGAGGGPPTPTYLWDFGDGTATSSLANPSHVFASAGVYTVRLTVTDALGRIGSNTLSVTVASANPTASFVSSTFNAGTHTMTFDGSGSSAVSPATITSYAWAYGDGTSAVGAIPPNKTYGSAGTYSVRLTVTDNANRTGSVTINVTVP